MSVLSCYFVYEAGNEKLGQLDWLYMLIGLLLAFSANSSRPSAPNHFIGLRTPWTLADDENWHKTHRFGGRVWFLGGAVLALAGLFFGTSAIAPFFIGLLVLICLLPLGYSYWLHQNKKPNEFV